MTRSTSEYLGLITSEHAGRPNFVATVGLSVDPLARMQVALEALITAFDLDSAVGPQLDAVGVRIGLSRSVPYSLGNLFFSLDDTKRGLDQGVWKGPYDVGFGLYRLDDETYRRLLRAKILANNWDGTFDGEEAIYLFYFDDPANLVFVSDDAISAQPERFFSLDDPLRGLDESEWAPDGAVLNTPSLVSVDMALTVGFAGKIPSLVDLAILNARLVGAKPEGVSVTYAVTSVDETPLFGLDLESDYIAGFDVGAWGVSPATLISQSV